MKRSLLVICLAAFASTSCKKDKNEKDPLTTGTWIAVASGGGVYGYGDDWKPLADGPSIIFYTNATFKGGSPGRSAGTSVNGTWKRMAKPTDVPQNTHSELLEMTFQFSDGSGTGKMLLTYIAEDSIRLDPYFPLDMRPLVNPTASLKYVRRR